MKLQYSTVEQNIKKLNENIKLYNEAVTNNDNASCIQTYTNIMEILFSFKRSINSGHYFSKDLVFFNGGISNKPIVFYLGGYRKLLNLNKII